MYDDVTAAKNPEQDADAAGDSPVDANEATALDGDRIRESNFYEQTWKSLMALMARGRVHKRTNLSEALTCLCRTPQQHDGQGH